ncbi:MAG: 4-alpha-glucanotransferase [Vicinamibacterales bacterium]
MSDAVGRRAGILIPLFSFPSSRSWGIGEITDLPILARWLEGAAQRLLQLLPINALAPGESSPYSALSAMAIDPQFISLHAVDDFNAAGGEAALSPGLRRELDAVRRAPAVDYRRVRALKDAALRQAFAHFRRHEWERDGARAQHLRSFIDAQAWWLDDYVLYRALRVSNGERPWTEWPEPQRARHPEALAAARRELADEILFRQYVQWLAGSQWQAARQAMGSVQLFGDLPFMVSGDSADVWSRQEEFRLDASVGVPPDAFSDTGQDWGLPAYRWDVCEAGDFEWLRRRARRNADLYDGYRVDHLVGFYRTFIRPHGGEPEFVPAEEAAQTQLGERLLTLFREPGAEIIAEDLGTVPDFVRESLARLGVPGYKVFRWERQWEEPGQPFRDPREYPARAVATSGTHDTEPMVVWWEAASAEEREAVLAIPGVRELARDPDRPYEALLETLFASGADLLILPVQDVFGWRDRINQPATVGDSNWTWRMPWPVDQMANEPAAQEISARLAGWARRHGRSRVEG